jgi:hypothetical protein
MRKGSPKRDESDVVVFPELARNWGEGRERCKLHFTREEVAADHRHRQPGLPVANDGQSVRPCFDIMSNREGFAETSQRFCKRPSCRIRHVPENRIY